MSDQPHRVSRRTLLKTAAAAPLARVATRLPQTARSVVVVGAGAFGGWTALHLLRAGARVTLVDAWGPGNSRASSGGETRIIRANYGADRVYVKFVARALQLWRENQARWGRTLYRQIGCLWMAGKDDAGEKAAVPLMREAGLVVDELTVKDATARYPQINFEDVNWVIYERDAGYLTARLACQAVMEGFVKEGGEYRQLSAKPGALKNGALEHVLLSDGSTVSADQYVFACGPWLGQVFPDAIGPRVSPTRQEVFFFGTDAGDHQFLEDRFPAWIDNTGHRFYGIPGNQFRGFKIADDTRGAPFDPTSGDRVASAAGVAAARKYLSFRFPALKNPPLLESRVCQYEQSPDERFIIDRHPQADSVWLVGGGSGHGFKHGPALGEWVSKLVMGEAKVDPFFALGRF